MKLYTPQSLAKENENISLKFIYENVERLGFVRIGKGRGRWLACEDTIKAALTCSTSNPLQSTGTSSLSTTDEPLESPLAARISEMQKEFKINGASNYSK